RLDDGIISECREIRKEKSIIVSLEDLDAHTKLNPEQEQAFKIILERIDCGQSGLFFIDGPGGTGKTFLYRALLANIRSRDMIELATVTSGVAAALLSGGCTAHSRFEIPLQTTDATVTRMSKQSVGAKLIKKAKLIIWDEASMASRRTIKPADRSFRDILDINEPFGGKIMVFEGDFRQVLLVIPKSTRSETVNASLVKSHLWHRMERIKLTKNMRARTDQSLSEFLLRIGNGEKPTIRDDLVLLPKQLVIQNTSNSPGEDTLVKEIFPSMDKNASGAKYMIERAILARRNEYVDQLNEMLIFKFPGESRTFLSFDSAEDDTNNYYQEDYLNTLTPNGLPPHKLVLKKNASIMLLRNLDASNGLCNDTRIICRGFDKNVIHAEIMIGENAFKHVFIPRIQLSPPENEGYSFKFIRKQFSVRLRFLMTINKAQRQTIPTVG
ncbi:ATP-dependent DNA helicase pfh1-like, partial [Capsicum annuum]|uniref:ATP-dependent DNA helicase pfh1-like n=1 Tax=Capsicum annuum TaxID=4072 RepID=UPI001FB18B2F